MIKPLFLNPGDHAALIAPAKKIEKDYILEAINVFEKWGLKVKTGQHLFHQHYRYAGNDAARLQDLQQAMDDPEVKVIFAGRGGYGTNRIVDQLNWEIFLRHPKWLVGFSDITVLLGEACNREVVSIHGIMPSFFLWEKAEVSIVALRQLLFGNPPDVKAKPHKLNNEGTAQGQVIGGNLAILNSMIGTPSDFEYKNKILVLEEISESRYKVDRMMIQLKRSGKLEDLKGLVCGQFTDCNDDDEPFGHTAWEIVNEHTAHLDIPKAFDFPIGHTAINYPVIIGAAYSLSVSDTGATLVPLG